MLDNGIKSSKRVLEPYERISEVLFGLIMVLTFTGSLSVAGAGREEVRTMLIGALGCNLAWGVIDAIMYLMACLSERGEAIRALRAVRASADPSLAHGVIAAALPPLVASALSTAEFEAIRQRLEQLPAPPARVRLGKDEWLGALGVFLLVFVSTLPVVLPFAFVDDARRALRLSNGIAVVMLFLCGYVWGRHAGRRPWAMGLSMVLVGIALVGMTMVLGG